MDQGSAPLGDAPAAERAASAFLLDQPAGRAQRRHAVGVVLLSILLFGALAPFVRTPLAPLQAFVPIYESALLINDTLTAVLLFGQYRILRSRALMMLGSGYLFTGVMVAIHALTFPGVFAPQGLLGAGPQTTAWLYIFWHAGFPLFVLAYAGLRRQEARASAGSGQAAPLGGRAARDPVALAFPVAALALCAAFAGWATLGQDGLPTMIENGHFTLAVTVCASGVWVLCMIGVGVLLRQWPHSVLDLWLTVALVGWSFDVALSAMLNGARFDLGFYAGRIYGLLAGSVVLIELLFENVLLYARLVRVHEHDLRQRPALRAARDQARAADAAKSLFLANMSHDGVPGVGVVVKPGTPSRLFDAMLQLQHGEGAPQAPATVRKFDLAEALSSIRGARVLLAEDNPVNQQVASAFLEDGGLRVTLAENGLEAVEWIKKADFDVVLMDMQMPEMDGVQATRVIRLLPRGEHLPIIAMTAAAMESDKQDCLAAGMNAHVAKPIDAAQLVKTMLAWVHLPLDRRGAGPDQRPPGASRASAGERGQSGE